MSKRYPECPLYNHDNCKDLHIPKVCAIIREDKICLRKYRKGRKTAEKSNTPSLSPEFKEAVKRIKNKEPELDAVIDKDDLKCRECGEKAEYDHHVIPKSIG